MAYLTQEYYNQTFGGAALPDDAAEFQALARMASDVIDAAVTIPINAEDAEIMEGVQKACAYEAEYLYAQGGQDAISGKAESNLSVTEKLDDYSVTRQQSAGTKMLSVNGIPFSPLAYAVLRGLGLMSRWVYAKQYRERVRAHGE